MKIVSLTQKRGENIWWFVEEEKITTKTLENWFQDLLFFTTKNEHTYEYSQQ